MLEGVEDQHYTFPRMRLLPQQCLPDPSQCECYIFLYKNGRFVENLCECDHQSILAQVELRNVHTPWPHGLSSCTRDAPHAKGNSALQLQPTHCRPAAPGMKMKAQLAASMLPPTLLAGDMHYVACTAVRPLWFRCQTHKPWLLQPAQNRPPQLSQSALLPSTA